MKKKHESDAMEDSLLTRKVRYASFNQRMIAALIDITLIMVVGYPLCHWAESALFMPVNVNNLLAPYYMHLPPDQLYALLWQQIRGEHVIERTILTNAIQFALIVLYILPFWMKYGSTPGKMLLSIEIRDADSYELMTQKQKIKRFSGYIVSGIPFALGFIWMLFNRKRRQCWHDKIAHTVVVMKEKKKPAIKLRSESV